VTESGKSGLIASDDELAQTIVNVLKDDALRTKLREAGLRRAQDFSWDTVCARYEAIYSGSAAPAAQRLPAQETVTP
jgi:glycosyltransferase involved in cell wall biosynthesis